MKELRRRRGRAPGSGKSVDRYNRIPAPNRCAAPGAHRISCATALTAATCHHPLWWSPQEPVVTPRREIGPRLFFGFLLIPAGRGLLLLLRRAEHQTVVVEVAQNLPALRVHRRDRVEDRLPGAAFNVDAVEGRLD